ncbi:uncharacterized protein LOC124275120 [Haliotis rubra]|uniref:uncharacterized protein LOC124275120 n=1 Tax=Haliotis rubra TaxID=36100 RepID=UPI001EE5AFE5|nr:uncharacterized protein LOC124275120 [Haliotis rubra]
MMDHSSLKILDFEVVEVTEAKSSCGMEKIGFERVLDRLIGCTESESGMHVSISDVSTDRHVSVRKLMREKYAPMHINHQFDAYHMYSALAPWVQSICNHLFWCAASCMGDADLLVARWESLRYHIVNIHQWGWARIGNIMLS